MDRDALLGLGVFQGADFLAVAFFTAFADVALLLAVPRCADAFLAACVPADVFLAGLFVAAFFVAAFFVADFFVADFLVAAFFVAAFFVAALRAGVFFVTDDVAPRVFDVFLAAVFEAPPALVEAPALVIPPL
ncbi:hypothetical protein XnspCFBP7698_21020 [Xanthomonas sp. CFBP 7698]|nr:hypothetical protein XnspCFBP7698_21020 [Xanthomonas sp. CFBP 7698]